MNVLINHCWCSDSIWGGVYDCQVIVSMEKYACREDIYAGKNTTDWNTILDKFQIEVDEFGRKRMEDVYCLKPEVVQWLDANVKDKNCKMEGRTELSLSKGWGVGTDQYNVKNRSSFSLFFERPKDALAFIKQWSEYKNPVDYLNYFQDIRRKLNPKTGRLQRIPRWNN